MFHGRSYLEVRTEIDREGYPIPRCIALGGGASLPVKGVMERLPVKTAAGVQGYRYEVWIDDRTYMLYADNGFPLRWYVEVTLPFQPPREMAEAAD